MSWPFLLCVRGIWYTALFRVSLRGVGLRCVGLAQKISARCNTGSYVFSFFFIWIFILLLALSHIYVFLFPQRVPSDLEVGYEKSILTRTETFSITICFKEPLLFITLFLKRACFYLLLIFIRTWNYVPIHFFVSWLPKTVCGNIGWEVKSSYAQKIAFSFLATEGESMQWSFPRPL